MIIGENTAKYAGGRHMKKRLAEIIDVAKQEEKSCEEITVDIIKRAGLVVKE